MRMEIEVPGNSLYRSRYWLVALIADNSHFVHLDAGRAPGRLWIAAITSCATSNKIPGMRICEGFRRKHNEGKPA
jgi:hypothetical protein